MRSTGVITSETSFKQVTSLHQYLGACSWYTEVSSFSRTALLMGAVLHGTSPPNPSKCPSWNPLQTLCTPFQPSPGGSYDDKESVTEGASHDGGNKSHYTQGASHDHYLQARHNVASILYQLVQV